MIAGVLIAGISSLLQAAEPPAAAPAPSPVQRVATRRVLDIPDEIAPAIVPYVQCRMASRGVPQHASEGGPPIRSAVPAGVDCSPHRTQASRRAEGMLRAQGRGSLTDRRAFVERVLAGVDAFADGAGRPPADLPDREPDAED